MKYIFVDANVWIALNYKRDQCHTSAVKINQSLLKQGCHYITTNFVLDETYTGLLKKITHHRIVEFGECIRHSKVIRIIHIDSWLEKKAWELFKKYSDKRFSFTDCTSFIVMQDLILTKAFTNDHHFEQMRYQILLTNYNLTK